MRFLKRREKDTGAETSMNAMLGILEGSASLLVRLFDGEDARAIVVNIIQNEKKLDRLRESLVAEIYTKKRYLPSFQKADTLRIISSLDDIMDCIELVARHVDILLSLSWLVPGILVPDLVSYTTETASVVHALVAAVRVVIVDLATTPAACDLVQNERRAARETQWRLLKQVHSLDLDAKLASLLQTIIRLVVKVADKSEELSDELHGLAIKYKSLD